MDSAPRLLLASIAVALIFSGCPKELGDVFENTEKERQAHRMGGPKEEEPEEDDSAPVAEAKAKDTLKGRRLKPGSVASRLYAEIVKRIKCQEPECSQDVLTRLQKAKDTFAPAFGELLDGQQAEPVTIETIKVAGILGLKEAAEGVGTMAVQNPGEMRSEAIWSLGSIGGKEAVAQLRRLAGVGMNTQAQEKVCKAYGRIKMKEAIPDVAELLRSPSKAVRSTCAIALGLTKSDQAVTYLAPLLEDSRKEVQRAATRALRAIGSDEAKKALAGAGK